MDLVDSLNFIIYKILNRCRDSNWSQAINMEGPETEMDIDGRLNVTSILHAYSLTLPVTQTYIRYQTVAVTQTGLKRSTWRT
jgi:hypothetical protein